MHYLSITGEWEKYINILKIKKLDIFLKNKKNRSPVNLVTDNLDKWIVPAIATVIIAGGIMSVISIKKRNEEL